MSIHTQTPSSTREAPATAIPGAVADVAAPGQHGIASPSVREHTTTASCCAPARQEVCCEPAAKTACCGTGATHTCGCQ